MACPTAGQSRVSRKRKRTAYKRTCFLSGRDLTAVCHCWCFGCIYQRTKSASTFDKRSCFNHRSSTNCSNEQRRTGIRLLIAGLFPWRFHVRALFFYLASSLLIISFHFRSSRVLVVLPPLRCCILLFSLPITHPRPSASFDHAPHGNDERSSYMRCQLHTLRYTGAVYPPTLLRGEYKSGVKAPKDCTSLGTRTKCAGTREVKSLGAKTPNAVRMILEGKSMMRIRLWLIVAG